MNKLHSQFFTEIKEKGLTDEIIRRFRDIIYEFYKKNKRKLPWRETKIPYYILVSEIMLQQTQAERVIPKYKQFLKAFPNIDSLAKASLDDVLKLWQGLGYNRRAISLKKAAEIIVQKFNSKVPSKIVDLESLPGIGKTTACEISSFAFNTPTVFIETNIRSVFIYFFFPNRAKIKDSEILPIVKKTVDMSNPREWYYALMDYGVMLKKKFPDLNKKSAHYQKQAPFKGSNRQIRGLVLKTVINNPGIKENQIVQKLKIKLYRLNKVLLQLEKEGFIIKKKGTYIVAK